jgi:hypothetical protein
VQSHQLSLQPDGPVDTRRDIAQLPPRVRGTMTVKAALGHFSRNARRA